LYAEEIKPHQQNVVVSNLLFYETDGYKSLTLSVLIILYSVVQKFRNKAERVYTGNSVVI